MNKTEAQLADQHRRCPDCDVPLESHELERGLCVLCKYRDDQKKDESQ